MHLFKLDDDRIINLDLIVELRWVPRDKGAGRKLRVQFAAPEAASKGASDWATDPLTMHLTEEHGGRLLWDYADRLAVRLQPH